jgi:hypothetical protein
MGAISSRRKSRRYRSPDRAHRPALKLTTYITRSSKPGAYCACLTWAPSPIAKDFSDHLRLQFPKGDAAFPWLLDLFDGRQSARTLYFLSAMLIALFIVVHLAMAVLAGPFNEIRSMITGRYVLPASKSK